MGHRKKNAPKRGSLAYLPRKRAGSIFARVRHWPTGELGAPALLGIAGYKAGMTHISAVEDRKRSPNYGREVIRPVTVIETPLMLVCAIRAYSRDLYGLRTFTEVWMEDPPRELRRILTMPERFSSEVGFKRMKENLEKVAKLRVIAITQPKQASVSKKKPDTMEIEIAGGTIPEQFDFASRLLGRTVTSADVFREGQYVDVIAVTTGKGFQGPVKRWGVRILQHKGRKTKRGIATLGPWKPAHVMHSVPRAGQMGFHQRTERNKLLIKIGTNGNEVTPRGGFVRYGVVQGPYLILEGSVPGPEKRPIKLRHPARPPKHVLEQPPQIAYLSLESPQGK